MKRALLLATWVVAHSGAFAHDMSLVVPGPTANRYLCQDLSRVVIAHHELAHDGSSGRDNEHLDPAVVQTMVDEAVMAFTGAGSREAAWEQIIPDPTKKVAIKVNCQITGIYTKAVVVYAITNGLIARGVPEDNIIIYDRTDNAFCYAGFEPNPTGPGVRVGSLNHNDFGGYSSYPELYEIAKLLIGESGGFDCDYLINVPVCKALDGYSGVTLSLKNHYGTCSPGHDDIHNQICRTNALSPIRDKTRLIVLDALFCEYQWYNGRDQTWVDVVNKVIVSDDPVAVDYLGWQMIEQLRSAHSIPPVNPYPSFIDYAADVYGLGTNDPDQMEILELSLHKPSAIFSDGFEDGTTSMWSVTLPGV
ncbi:MAG: DUF362 domain-containing protein [bacterium]|nr:DUF362 domain-containing protein [bacterium]